MYCLNFKNPLSFYLQCWGSSKALCMLGKHSITELSFFFLTVLGFEFEGLLLARQVLYLLLELHSQLNPKF
jgi:hypothetical protein